MLLPPPRPHTKGGHPRLYDRVALEGILLVLDTGIQWKWLPTALGYGSAVCWPAVMSGTSTMTAAPAGLVAVLLVLLEQLRPVAAAAPNLAEVAPAVLLKFVPVIVTFVPPAVLPLLGQSAVMVGATWPAVV